MTCILGIDPGVSGAIAFYFRDAPDRVSVEDAPVVDGVINAPALAERIRTYAPGMAVIEWVNAYVGGSSVSSFKFGQSFGIARGVVSALNVPLYLVRPAVWKKHFHLSADKERSRALACQLFPACAASFARKKDDGRAEAALIARYGADVLIAARDAA